VTATNFTNLRENLTRVDSKSINPYNVALRRIILLVLYKEGSLAQEELTQRTANLSLRLQLSNKQPVPTHYSFEEPKSVEQICQEMINENLLCLTSSKYELTKKCKAKAKRLAKALDNTANFFENHLLSTPATARNALGGYGSLAAVQTLTGFFTGSVGLIADGTGTIISTLSAGIVWMGIRTKKEHLSTSIIIVLMLASALSIGLDSISSIAANINGTIAPISSPSLVIIVECIAAVVALIFLLYQRFIGKRNQSLALITQSIDSKNNVFQAVAVIVAVICSIFGFHWVDSVIGMIIALQMTGSGLSLFKQVRRSLKGEQTDFNKYKLPFEGNSQQRREETYRTWILYTILQEKTSTKQRIVESLEKTYRTQVLPPIFNEFTVGKDCNFEEDFNKLITPLIEKSYVCQKEGTYSLTEQGRSHIRKVLSKIQYEQTAS
jgi:Mn-dependent DtxR family transcriptional regulator